MRVRFARILLRIGAFIQSLAVVVMKPDDLVEFSRQSYVKPQSVESWGENDVVDSGLSEDERELLSEITEERGNLLLLGLGGGREAITFARMGFQVTGVDYVEEMVEKAKENAVRRGLHIEGLVQEISQLDVPPGSFDVVWLSKGMYSCVPTRIRRVQLARSISKALRPGGLFLCQFFSRKAQDTPGFKYLLRRIIAVCTFGNLSYEFGDKLWENVEFIHEFGSDQEIRAELEEGGLSVIHIQDTSSPIRGSAVCKKSLEQGLHNMNGGV